MSSEYSIRNTLLPIKHHLGYLVNRTTNRWFGIWFSFKKSSFPYIAVHKRRFLNVRMDIVNKCNLRCRMCYFSLDSERIKQEPFYEMPIEVFRKIAYEVFPLTNVLNLSSGAEPLLSVSFPEILDIVASYRIPHVAFATNGMLLKPDTMTRIIQAGINEIAISLDGGTPQTYEAIRSGASFEKVIGNIRLFQELKQRLHSEVPQLYLWVVLMKANVTELPVILHLAKDLEVKRVVAAQLIPYEGLNIDDMILDYSHSSIDPYLEKARQVAKELGIEFNDSMLYDTVRAKDIQDSEDPKSRHCHLPWHEMFISPRGDVHPCCYWYEKTSLGNFSSQRFKEIWHGQAYRQLRQELMTGKLRETCLRCPLYSESNQAISKVDVQGGV